jgi:hypothetical protein
MARLKPRPTNLLSVDERNTRLAVLRAAQQALCREVGSKLPHSKMASALRWLFLGFVVLGLGGWICWQLDGFARWGAVWGCAEILDWPAYGEAQVAGYGERPVGLAEEFAGQDYYVGFALVEDRVGLAGTRDHAHRAGHDAGALADFCGERNLVAGGDGNLCIRNHAAGGTVN